MKECCPTSSISIAQGLYFLVTGLWPLVSSRTFQMVTGPKTDFWLVKTLGTLIAAVGGVLTLAGIRRKENLEVALLGVGSAASLAGSDFVYSTRKWISMVYFFDGIVELLWIALWVLALRGRKDALQ